MGKRELLQPQLQHKPRVRRSAHWFFAVITLVLAVVLLAFAAVLPNWLLYHRSAKYFSTTSQVSISDIHPYGYHPVRKHVEWTGMERCRFQ